MLPVTAHTGGVGRNTSDLSIVITSMGHYPHGPKGLLALPAVFLSVKARSDMGGAGVLELPAAADGRWCKLLRIAVNVMGGLSAGNKSFGRCGAAAHRGGGQRFFDSAERTGVVLDSVWAGGGHVRYRAGCVHVQTLSTGFFRYCSSRLLVGGGAVLCMARPWRPAVGKGGGGTVGREPPTAPAGLPPGRDWGRSLARRSGSGPLCCAPD